MLDGVFHVRLNEHGGHFDVIGIQLGVYMNGILKRLFETDGFELEVEAQGDQLIV